MQNERKIKMANMEKKIRQPPVLKRSRLSFSLAGNSPRELSKRDMIMSSLAEKSKLKNDFQAATEAVNALEGSFKIKR
jgi:hypothetical protein